MKHVSRSLCDSNLQGTNKRNDKESRWESFLLCSTNFSSFFLFFSIFRMTSTNRHHIILFYWTWRTNCIYPPVRKKSIVFPDDRRFELLWSDSKFSYHISIKEYTKFFAYNTYVYRMPRLESINSSKENEWNFLFKHSYKFLFRVRFLQYWFMWPHV